MSRIRNIPLHCSLCNIPTQYIYKTECDYHHKIQEKDGNGTSLKNYHKSGPYLCSRCTRLFVLNTGRSKWICAICIQNASSKKLRKLSNGIRHRVKTFVCTYLDQSNVIPDIQQMILRYAFNLNMTLAT
jgi:hypothetical protein